MICTYACIEIADVAFAKSSQVKILSHLEFWLTLVTVEHPDMHSWLVVSITSYLHPALNSI